MPKDSKPNWRAPVYLVCGDTLAEVMAGLKTHRGRDRLEEWAGITHADEGYSTDINLAPGWSFESSWDPVPDAWYWNGQEVAPAHTCPRHKDTANDPGIGLVLEPYLDSKAARSYGNGVLTFVPDFSNDAFLKSFVRTENVRYATRALVPAETNKPAVVVLNLTSPYILTKARGEAPGAAKVEVSVDGGQVFTTVELKEFTAAVKGRLQALVKVTFRQPLTALNLEAIVQNNPGALPYLSPGKNLVTVSAADPEALGRNTLVVTYAYRLGWRAKSPERVCAEGEKIANQHAATWSQQVTCVRKIFSAKDLPVTFEINCPTPKGRYPVFPRMVFLRREVIAPDSLPQPLPTGAVGARVGPDEELSTLPNPFLVGTEAAVSQSRF